MLLLESKTIYAQIDMIQFMAIANTLMNSIEEADNANE